MNKQTYIHVGVEVGALAILGALTGLAGFSFSELGVYAPLAVSAVSILTSVAHKYLDKYAHPKAA